MDARPANRAGLRTPPAAVLVLLAAASLGWLCPRPALAANSRTTNFVVDAPTQALAEEIGRSAEQWRRRLAIEWLGEEMPAWSQPCPIRAEVSPRLGAGGETSFTFQNGEVFGWTMRVQGSRQRVLDSVLPHEITHTIFASHFRRPLPRWADEGACTTVEHPEEVGKQERMLIRFLKTGRGISFSHMFAMREYPRDVLPLYSQGHSLTTFLIERRGKQEFLKFLADGMADDNWPQAVERHYGHPDLYDLQNQWLAWVERGRPRLPLEPAATAVAANPRSPAPRVATNPRPAASGSVYTALTPTRNDAADSSNTGSTDTRVLLRRQTSPANDPSP